MIRLRKEVPARHVDRAAATDVARRGAERVGRREEVVRRHLAVDVRPIEGVALPELRRNADVQARSDVAAHESFHELRGPREDERTAHHRRRVAIGEAHAPDRADRSRILRVVVGSEPGDKALDEKLPHHVGLADPVVRARRRRVVDLHGERAAVRVRLTGEERHPVQRPAARASKRAELARGCRPRVRVVVKRAAQAREETHVRDTVLARGHGRDIGLAVFVPVARDDLRREPRHRTDRPRHADHVAEGVPVRREHEVHAR